ncbi:MAG: alpha/beta hydrolase, partial [Planctomycetota bacterium]
SALNRDVSDAFLDRLKEDLSRSGADQIYIFVHGYNTKLDSNTRIAAQIHHFLGGRGVMLSYEWPSRGNLTGYEADKASALYSVRYFRLLIDYLSDQTDARTTIIAHSAGAPVAVLALSQLGLAYGGDDGAAARERFNIDRLVLVAPDLDIGLFENAIHDELPSLPRQMSIYMSTHDRALEIAAWLRGVRSLGSGIDALTEEDLLFIQDKPNVEIIDVGPAEKRNGSWLGHSYFHSDPWVSSDVLMAMRFGALAQPQDRGLVQSESGWYWTVPHDYLEHAIRCAQELVRMEEHLAEDIK